MVYHIASSFLGCSLNFQVDAYYRIWLYRLRLEMWICESAKQDNTYRRGPNRVLLLQLLEIRRVNMKLLAFLFLHLTLAATLVVAADQVVFTIVDRIQFSVPGDWPVIASKSTPEKTIFAFQIPNRADEETPDSTNLSIISSYLKDAKDRAAFDKKAATSEHGAVDKTLIDGWGCRSFTAMQDKTQYVDWDCFRVVADCGIFVRMAWPHLPKNPVDFDNQMQKILSDFLASVGPSKKLAK